MIFSRLYNFTVPPIARTACSLGRLGVSCAFSTSTDIIPVDQASFRYIRENNLLYIDKTKLICEQLLKTKSIYYFIARPKRWGKSLICSTIGEIFSGNKSLFKGLDIYQDEWDFKLESRPVIHINMARCFHHDLKIYERMLTKLLAGIGAQYGIQIEQGQPHSPMEILADLIERLSKPNERKAVVIIDEYDVLINHYLSQPHTSAKEVHKIIEFHQEFYGILKSLEDRLRLVFITGRIRFCNISLCSKLNNFIDLSMELSVNNLFGYTEEEMKRYFQPYIQELMKKNQISSEEGFMNELRKRYNGYCFGVDVDTGLLPNDRVYHPFAINHVFGSLSLNSDKWITSGHSSGMIVKKLASSHLNSSSSFTDVELTEYSINHSHSPNNLSLLMYFTGYLTVDRFDSQSRIFHMKVPNKSITDHLSSELELILPETIKDKLINDYSIHCQRFVEVLLDHKLSNEEKQAILVDLLDTFVHLIPHQLLKSNNKALESIYNVLFSSALRAGLKKHQIIINEKYISGEGLDVILFDGKSHSRCIIEFKCNGDLGKAFHQAAIYHRKYPNIEKRKQFWVAINIVNRSKDNTADLPPSERPSVQVKVHNHPNNQN